ncbi:MAG: hypothetical protein KDF54_05730 [Hydrogenophaga sp.]|nr:hypothetical protein [Hydrogenophaga sp.]
MKYLLVLAVLLLAFWNWRNNRQDAQQSENSRAPRKGSPNTPVVMIACAQCGTHLPEHEAVEGVRGRYCCQEHRRQHEATSRQAD